MVQSTYALRDSSKLNSIDHTYSTTDNKHNKDNNGDNCTYSQYKKKHSTTTTTTTKFYSSDYYTSNDPQYYQHQVKIIDTTSTTSKKYKRKNNRMSSRKTKSNKQRGVTGRKKRGSKTSSSSMSMSMSGGTCAYNTQTGISSSTTTRIQTPGANDVLCGRGGNVNSHPGNIAFRSIVAGRKLDYNLTPVKTEKSVICQEVIQQVHDLNPRGRFLQKPEGCNWWVECDNAKAMAKTSQALREGAPKLRSGVGVQKRKNVPAAAAGSRTSSKKGRRSSLGKRKRIQNDEEKDIHDREIEDAKHHPRIVPMPNGHRGKQLVLRPDGNGEVGGDDDVRDVDIVPTTTSDTTNGNVEHETTEAHQNRIKRLKTLMKPRSPASTLPATPSSQPPLPPLPTSRIPPQEGQPPPQCVILSTEDRQKLRPVDGTVVNHASTSSTPSAFPPEDMKNLFPTPTNGVLPRPPDSFYRQHSMAFSDGNHDSSFRGDDKFVNPFQDDDGPDVLETNKSIGISTATATETTNTTNSCSYPKIGPSPTSTAVTPSHLDVHKTSSSSVTSTPIANVGFYYSPLKSTSSNHDAAPPAPKESSFPSSSSSSSKPEANVYNIEPQNRSFTAFVDKGNASNSSKW